MAGRIDRFRIAGVVLLAVALQGWPAEGQLRVVLPGAVNGRNVPGKEGPVVSVDVNRGLLRDLGRAKDRMSTPDFAPAIEFLQERIIDRPEDFFVDQEMKGTLKSEARALLIAMTPEQRKHYDLRYSATAQQLLENARAQQNLDGLAEVARRYFLTDAGAEAAYRLGSAYLERGRPLQAALLLSGISPRAGTKWEPILSLKTAIGWRLGGFPDRAEAVLVAARQRMPAAQLEFGADSVSWFDKDEPPLAWLDRTARIPERRLKSRVEESWMTPRGEPARNGSAVDVSPLWRTLWTSSTLSREETASSDAVRKAANEIQRLEEVYRGSSFLSIPAASPVAATDVSLPVMPRSLAGTPPGPIDIVLFRTLANVRAVHLQTGRTLWESILIDPDYERIIEGETGTAANNQPQQSPLQMYLTQRCFRDVTAGTLSTDGERVYSVEEIGFLNPFAPYMNARGLMNGASQNDSNRLVAAELSTGRLLWEVGGPRIGRELPLAGTFFLGPPLALNGVLYILGEDGGAIALHALEPSTGGLLWSQTLVIPENSLDQYPARRMTGLTPAESNGILVCPTDGGAAIAVDLDSRQLLWGLRYKSTMPNLAMNAAMRFQMMNMARMGQNSPDDESRWLDTTPVIAEGCVLFTPRDSEELLCVRLLDGTVQWKRPRGQSLYIAAVDDGNVVLVGRSHVEAVRLHETERATADAPPVPKAGWREPTPLVMPSGRGVRCGPLYHIPLSTSEIATIELKTGRLVARTQTKNNVVPGNLIAIRGSLITQTTQTIMALESLENTELEIADALKNRPNDALALALRGELHLHRGQTAAALTDLRASVKDDPKSPARPILAAALLEGLRHDFAANRQFSAEIEGLIDDPQQRASFLRLTASGLAQVGERQAAFAQYLKLAAPDAAAVNLERLNSEHSARSDRWVRARLAELMTTGSPDDRRHMEQLIQVELDKILAEPDAARLSGFLHLFGDLPAADRVRRRLCDLLDPAKDGLTLEATLLRLKRSSDETLAAYATARLLSLYLDRERHQSVPGLLKDLEKKYPAVVALDDKTGAQLAESWKSDDNVLQLIAGEAIWPERNLEAKKSARRGGVEQEFPIEIVGPRGAFDGWRLFCDNRRTTITARDGAGQDRWTLRVESLKDPRRPNDPARIIPNVYGNSARVHGHQMVISLGSYFVVLDALVPGAAPRILWMRELIDQVGGPANPYGVQPRQIVLPNGMRNVEMVDSLQRPIGAVGFINDEMLVYQVGTTLIAADPLTGESLWERKNIVRGSKVFGDDQHLFVVAPGSQQAIVVRSTDGQSLGARTLPPQESRLFLEGRRVVAWTRSENRGELFALDPLTGRRLWERKFEGEARASIVEEEEIGLLEPNGRFSILDSETGQPRLEARLEGVETVEQITIIRSSSRYMLFTYAPPAQAAMARRVQLFNSFSRTFVANGPAWAFDRETGRPQWTTKIEQQQLELSQPEDLPLLVFSALRFNGGTQEWAVQLLDVRNGRSIYSDASPSNTIPYRLRIDSVKKTFAVDFYNSGIEVSVSESPLLPGELPPSLRKE